MSPRVPVVPFPGLSPLPATEAAASLCHPLWGAGGSCEQGGGERGKTRGKRVNGSEKGERGAVEGKAGGERRRESGEKAPVPPLCLCPSSCGEQLKTSPTPSEDVFGPQGSPPQACPPGKEGGSPDPPGGVGGLGWDRRFSTRACCALNTSTYQCFLLLLFLQPRRLKIANITPKRPRTCTEVPQSL